MKVLLLICITFFSTFASANELAPLQPPTFVSVKGTVLEVKDVTNYTYLHIKTKRGDEWAAIRTAPVKKGSVVTVENAMVIKNFESKTLKQKFKTIVFGNLASEPQAKHVVPVVKKSAAIHITKALGKKAHTVAEIISMRDELKGKIVLVSGKVVKYNAKIMGKNWIHLRDGSGGDLLVTTANETKVGDVVTVKGIVRTNKDFGAGYSYNVLLEDATLQ
ncbi:MAG: nucleotide-binding protein [Gallionella sp.]